jgi:hypothetical protein
MSNKILIIFTAAIFSASCAVEASKTEDAKKSQNPQQVSQSVTQNSQKPNTIEIKPDSPADTVRAFYTKLREKKYREAFFLTNLRPAIEGLTDAELKELQVDFEHLANRVPAELEINGEIISGEKATVTANLPDGDGKPKKIQPVNLRREKGVWIILTLDAQAEKAVKREGNKYFFALRNDTYQDEAQNTLEKIMKAQAVFSMQNGGIYGSLPALIEKGLVSADVQKPELSGYRFSVALSFDGKNYIAAAEPVEYGKTGKLSFLAETKNGENPVLTRKDAGGKSLKGQ